MQTPSVDNLDSAHGTAWSADELIPFGKYILLNKINSGATAAVYRAKIRGEAGFERLVAIKRILPHMAGDPEFVNTFVREAKTAARLNHTNICPIYELGKVGESLYIAMEWVAGKDLGAITRRLHRTGETMPPAISAFIASRLCDALDYAHTLKDARGRIAGIIHRDLSPTNIVVSYEGQVKLIDFGLAKAAGRAQQTNVDALKQKLGYMSPELVKGKAPDARSDVFGVGVCLYEMITARRLFAGKDDMATLKMVSNASVPPPSALVEDAPEELEVIVMHALERDPDARWQTAGEMGQALQGFITQHEPMFGSRQVGDFMRRLFAEDMAAEQKRVNELLEASRDAQALEERRRFFASPAGAAAMAKAEVARRVSVRPPTVASDPGRAQTSDVAARNIPKTPALPRVAVDAGLQKPHPSAPTAPSPGARGAQFEDEPTNFFEPAEKKDFEDEPTAFFDGEAHAKAAEAELRDTARPAAKSDPAGFLGERTEFLGDEALDAAIIEEAPAAAAATAAEPADSGFGDEEATHIFFNKDDGTGVAELMADEADPEPARRRASPAPASLNAPIVSPQALVPQQPPAAARTTPTPAPPAVRHSPVPERRRTNTLQIKRARKPDRLSNVLLIAGLLMLALAVAGLIARTPIGVALGLRRPSSGAIEIRTTPVIDAAVKLDGVYRGRAPLRMDGVRAGRRVVDLEAPGFQPISRELDLVAGTTAMLDITLTPKSGP